MKNIVVALDFSPIAEDLLQAAIDQTRGEESKIWLIHIAAPDPDFVGYEVGPGYIRDDRAATLKAEHKQLSEYKEQLIRKGTNTEALLVQGPTVQSIVFELEKLKADLLVIGKKGHSLMYKAFVGSVFNEVLKEVQIPMLVIPGKE